MTRGEGGSTLTRYLSIYLSIYLYIYLLSIRLSIYTNIYQLSSLSTVDMTRGGVQISPGIYLSIIYLFIYPSIYLSIYLSTCISIYLSIYQLSSLSTVDMTRGGVQLSPGIYLSIIYPSIYLSIHYLSVYLSIHMTGCMGKRVFCDMGGNFEKYTF